MKKIYSLFIIVSLLAIVSCFEDEKSSEGPKGTLNVTVNTSEDVWGYPVYNQAAYDGDTTKQWCYPAVGGDAMAGTLIPEGDVGFKKNYIYLFKEFKSVGDPAQLTAKDLLILYRGEGAGNNSVITIDDIEPGDYYVVAFYDYNLGSKLTNILNSYDRYALYTDDPLDSTANSTPYADLAAMVTIEGDETVEFTLDIKRDWVLGKPEDGMGRVFLNGADAIPVPVP